jgi:hypothetical protein
MKNEELIDGVRLLGENGISGFLSLGSGFMNTCCNEWRNWRSFEGVHERQITKNGTCFYGKAVGVLMERMSASRN